MEGNKKIEAKEKRGQERLFRVEAGVAEMEVWLKDLVRRGLLALPEKEPVFFDKIRARMVDAQATGLGNLVRDLRELNYYKGNAWQSEALVIVAEIYLLLEGFKRFADLDALTQNDLKLLLGWNVSQKEILENETLPIEKDNWLLFHQASELVDDITVQRNWFYGLEHGKFALVLYFAFRNMPIANTLQLTSVTAMDLVYVPSAMPTRALIKQQDENIEDIDFQYVALANFAEMQVDFTEKIAHYPWADNVPFLIAGLTPVIYENANYLKDECGAILPLPLDFESMKWWSILAISGGKSLTMFVLWNKGSIVPLGIMGRKRYVAI